MVPSEPLPFSGNRAFWRKLRFRKNRLMTKKGYRNGVKIKTKRK